MKKRKMLLVNRETLHRLDVVGGGTEIVSSTLQPSCTTGIFCPENDKTTNTSTRSAHC